MLLYFYPLGDGWRVWSQGQTHALKFSASSIATRAWKSGVASQMPVAAGGRSSGEGAGRTAAVWHGLQEQAGHLRYPQKSGCTKLLRNGSVFEGSRQLQCSAVEEIWGNLSDVSGKGGCTSETKAVRSRALALLSARSTQCKFGVTQGECKSELRV